MRIVQLMNIVVWMMVKIMDIILHRRKLRRKRGAIAMQMIIRLGQRDITANSARNLSPKLKL
jgi:hypothetical protein